jgi:hypothetical protein
MIVKDTPTPLLLKHLPEILWGDVNWWARALRSRHPGAAARAYGTVIRRLPTLRRQRREILRGRTLSNGELERLLG